MILRPEQRETIDKILPIMEKYKIAYLAAAPRTGKTIMSLTVAKELGWRNVGFVTKLKAIKSVELDHVASQYGMNLTIKNFERILELPNNLDGFIIDEAHSIGKFAKPSKRAKDLKSIVGKTPVLLMSGTPSPESFSQLFHQFFISYYCPFVYPNFYKFAKDFVDVKQKFINGYRINDYTHANKEKIMSVVNSYMVTLSQAEAGFMADVEEEVLLVPMKPQTDVLLKILKDKKVYEFANGDMLIADTPVKMQSLFHQISSGTVIAQGGSYILDKSKVDFIKNRFWGMHIAIFYSFIKELELLQQTFPNNTSDPEEFNADRSKTFIGQFISSREGVSLRTADCIVAFNISFSATTFFQFRQRTQHKDKKENSKLYWIFSQKGIERAIYKVVQNKKSYTNRYFLKDFGLKKW